MSSGEWFIVFYLSLMKDYRHGMLCSNVIYFFESIFYYIFKYFECIFEDFHRRYMCGCLVPIVMIIRGSTFHLTFISLSISSWYFPVFIAIVSGENLSL